MLDAEQLLVPISDSAPCGEDLSFSPEFDAIAEARRADDPTLEQGEWQTDLKTADWPQVIDLCGTLLRERSKDVRLAIWMTEAYTYRDGFSGLAGGYRLLAQLCDRFWDDLHPCDEGEDSDDGSLRVGHIRWLLSHSVRWIRDLPITQAPEGRYTANDFQIAHARAGSDAAEEDGRPTLDVLEAARRATPFEFYTDLAAVAPDCLVALDELAAVVDARAGDDGPSFRSSHEAIELVSDMIQRFARDAGVHMDGSADTGAAAPATGDMVDGSGSPASGEVATRRQALAQLRQVAAFFRRTEPHSPVAYLADKAAKWGEMPLHVWLRRVIKDGGTLSAMEEMLDVEKSGEEGEME